MAGDQITYYCKRLSLSFGILVGSLLILVMSKCYAQEKIKFNMFNNTEFGVYYASRYKLKKEEFQETVTAKHTAYVIGIRHISGWNLSKLLFAGLGAGYEGIVVDGAQEPDQLVEENGTHYYTYKYVPGTYYHTIPIYGHIRFYFRNDPESAYIYTDFGSFLNLDQNIERSLMLWGLGIGQRYQLKSGLMISGGIDFQERYLISTPNDKQRIPSLGLKLGLLIH